MGCKICKGSQVNPVIEPVPIVNHEPASDSVLESKKKTRRISINDDEILDSQNDANFVEMEVADPEAFNDLFIQRCQRVIKNRYYRSTIESWRPTSLPQLVESIKALSNDKSLIDYHWIIFYWITCNIEYDTVSYFSKNYADQSAEDVFRTRKGVCAGYANIYKYLCDQLNISCEIVSGYAKGYGFDKREDALKETDHAWNAVEIDHHWYLIESTWGSGHLTDQKIFEHELNSYYFCPRPNEMIYHHLPENDKWQLLRVPIKKTQYMQMPKIYPNYFKLNLELISPRNQAHVNLLPNKSYALVQVRAPADVNLIADLKLHDKKIEGGDRVIFNKKKQLYYCYFAPNSIGKYKITIYGKRGETESGTYRAAITLTLDIKQIAKTPISFPKTWQQFFDFNFNIISPKNTHLIKIQNEAQVEVLIQTPNEVQLLGRLVNTNGEKVEGGHQVFYDRHKDLWRCKFASNHDGIFEAEILAKNKSDPGYFLPAVSFTIDATLIPKPPLSYPKTSTQFFDLNINIISPKNTHLIKIQNEAQVEILIQTPNEVQLLGRLVNTNGEKVEGGHQVFYDRHQDLWRCKFAPNHDGLFEAEILAEKKSDPGVYTSAVSFTIDATLIPKPPLSYPKTWTKFFDLNLNVISPKNTHLIKIQNKTHVEVLIQAADNILLLGRLINTNKEEVPGGHQVFYDRHKDLWRCKFAPNHDGLFEAEILAKKKSDPGFYTSAVSFTIDATLIPKPPLSYPNTWTQFFDLNLNVISPKNTHLIKIQNKTHVEVLIQATDNILLLGRLINTNKEEVPGGHQVFYDRHKNLWRCKFAPNHDGIFEAEILAKKKSDPGYFLPAVSFTIDATLIPIPPLSYPNTWQLFHDLDLRIEAPRDRAAAVWPQYASFSEIRMSAPDDVQLSCSINYGGVKEENCTLAQYDNDKQQWQLLFAPQRTGAHKLFIYARRQSDIKTTSDCVAEFDLNVTKLRKAMKFPLTYTKFQTNRCRIYEPFNGVLKKDAIVPIHCFIPGATTVDLEVDSKWLGIKGYKDPILKTEITVGSTDVTIYAQYKQNKSYDGLVRYSVE